MSTSSDETSAVTSRPGLDSADAYRRLVETVADYAIFMLDPTGTVISWNKGAERIKGYTSAEILGRNFSVLYAAEDVAAGEPQRMLQRALAEGRCEEERQRLRKDGGPFWALVTVTALFDDRHLHIGFAEVTRDITELRRRDRALRKRAEWTLQASEARYHTLFQYAQVGIVLADAESVYIDANESACRMLGYTRAELVGLHASDIVAEGELRHIQPALGEIHARVDHQRQWKFRRKDGSVFAADVIATAMPDGTLLGMIRDVTDRQRAADYREHLTAIVESSRDAIVGKDLDGVVTSWNAGAQEIFGYSAEEMIGTAITRLIPDDRREEEGFILECLRRGERVEALETVRQTKDGRLIDVSVTISPIRDAGGVIRGASKIAREITSLKEREREIARLSRLYAALSQVNEAIVWTPTRDELFRKVCRALVEHGGLRMAWIGWHVAETHRLIPVADWGDEHGYLQEIEAYVDERLEGRGPSGTAFRTNRPHISNDALTDSVALPWHAELERRGYLAAAAFPIRMRGEVCGTLSVYADRRDFFHDKEVALLEEAASDVSFALDNFARDDARRQAERTLRNEKAFSDMMIETMPGVVYFFDVQGRFLRWNRNFETVSGYSGEEIAAMHPRDLYREEDRPLLESRIAEVFEMGESSVEMPFLSKDGVETQYYFTGRRVEFEGTPCLVGVGIDISDRRRAEARVRESEAHLVDAQRIAKIGSWQLDVERNRLTWSEQIYEMFGIPRSEFRSTYEAFLEFVHPEDRERLQEAQRAALAGQRSLDIEHRIVLYDGTEKTVHELANLKTDESGRPKFLAGTIHDITDRMRIEAEREARFRAEASDRIKSAFLATMSHELRTPLNSIIGFTGIVLQGLAGPLNPEQAKQLGMVRTSARHLLDVINDVLDISKIEAGQMHVQAEPFELRAAIERVTASVRPLAEKKGLTIETRISAELTDLISDQRRVEQILLNLLNNAIKFTEQGCVTLTAEPLAAYEAVVGAPLVAAARLRVTDTGIGIKPADLPTLFQPFRQLDTGLQRQHEGTGLGLAICRRLAELLGGEISAASKWGSGSEFTVILPCEGGVQP